MQFSAWCRQALEKIWVNYRQKIFVTTLCSLSLKRRKTCITSSLCLFFITAEQLWGMLCGTGRLCSFQHHLSQLQPFLLSGQAAQHGPNIYKDTKPYNFRLFLKIDQERLLATGVFICLIPPPLLWGGELTKEKVRGAMLHKADWNTNMTDCISSL